MAGDKMKKSHIFMRLFELGTYFQNKVWPACQPGQRNAGFGNSAFACPNHPLADVF
jgi:hypothetical protein